MKHGHEQEAGRAACVATCALTLRPAVAVATELIDLMKSARDQLYVDYDRGRSHACGCEGRRTKYRVGQRLQLERAYNTTKQSCGKLPPDRAPHLNLRGSASSRLECHLMLARARIALYHPSPSQLLSPACRARCKQGLAAPVCDLVRSSRLDQGSNLLQLCHHARHRHSTQTIVAVRPGRHLAVRQMPGDKPSNLRSLECPLVHQPKLQHNLVLLLVQRQLRAGPGRAGKRPRDQQHALVGQKPRQDLVLNKLLVLLKLCCPVGPVICSGRKVRCSWSRLSGGGQASEACSQRASGWRRE